MKKEIKTCYISFYPDEEAQGGVLREVLILKGRDFDSVLNKARKKGQELRARSFMIFQPMMPRIWVIDY